MMNDDIMRYVWNMYILFMNFYNTDSIKIAV